MQGVKEYGWSHVGQKENKNIDIFWDFLDISIKSSGITTSEIKNTDDIAIVALDWIGLSLKPFILRDRETL